MTHAPDVADLIPIFSDINREHYDILFGILDTFISDTLNAAQMYGSLKFDTKIAGCVQPSVHAAVEKEIRRILHAKGYRVKTYSNLHMHYNNYWFSIQLGIRKPPKFVAPEPEPEPAPKKKWCVIQ